MKINKLMKGLKLRKTIENSPFIQKIVISAVVIALFQQASPAYAVIKKGNKIQVSVTAVEEYKPVQQMEFPGVWVARNEITISSPLQVSRVKEIFVDEGDIVKAGQPLLQLEDSSLKTLVNSSEILLTQVKARINEISVRKKEADSLLNRAEVLKKSKAISQQQFDEISASSQSLGHQKKAIEAEADRVEQQLLDSKTQLSKSTVLAPVDGIISLRFVQEGELTNFSPLFRMYNNNELEFEAYVTQNSLAMVTTGMPAEIISASGSIQGEVRMVGTRVQRETGIAAIRIMPKTQFDGSIGSSGRATFVFQKKAINAIDIRAIRYEGRNPYVFVLDEQFCVLARPITLGSRYIDKAEVVTGLNNNERIVLSSAAFLKSGDCVQLEVDAAAPANDVESRINKRREKNRARQE